jgi:hypothetical protein
MWYCKHLFPQAIRTVLAFVGKLHSHLPIENPPPATTQWKRTSPAAGCHLAVLILSALTCLVSSSAPAAEFSGAEQAFLKKYCQSCHAGAAAEAQFDLVTLAGDLTDRGLFSRWERVYQRIFRGEMPPVDAEQPAVGERQAYLRALGAALTTAHQQQKGTVLRRLNRREYENTLNDLFGTNLKLADLLPEDGRSHEFENVGEALSISAVQMRKYLEAINLVLGEVPERTVEPPEPRRVLASYATTRDAAQFLQKVWLLRDDGAVVFFKQLGYPSGMLREANVEQDGWYTVRVRGYAFQSERPITFALGATTYAQGAEQPTFGFYSFRPGEPQVLEERVWLPARYMIEITPYGIDDQNNEIRQQGVLTYQGPGLAILDVEVIGPLKDEFPNQGHRLLYDGLQRVEIQPRNPQDKTRPWYKPKFQLELSDPDQEVRPVLHRIAEQAFRRPVAAVELAPYEDLWRAELAAGVTPEEALHTAVAAIFCSPRFLFLHEPIGELDDYALASRLSYFLIRSAPDAPLLAAAAAGELRGTGPGLRREAERLLQSPHFRRMLVDFTDAWLNLREIDFTNPDEQLYPEYDRYLHWSFLEETRGFLRELLEKNLPVSQLVKSDFAMLNERLAQHYDIPGVQGPELRRVDLPAGSLRGGLLSQGSVLKVSANGTSTSPVVRGVWVTERILGETVPPPPPGIPGVEPDIRGAKTLRELLDKHRSLVSCQGCHRLIDPPGFALEEFDPIGGWRERFRTIGQGERVQFDKRGQRVHYWLGPAVDSSGELLSGDQFTGFAQFREILSRQDERLARAFLTKLLTFATGRELGFSDQPELERLVEQCRPGGYGLRDLLLAAVESEIFRRK